MKVTVQCDGNGNNEVVFVSRVGSMTRTITLPIEEIRGIKYKRMSKEKEVEDSFMYKVAALLIEGTDCISVKDIPLITK